MIKKLNHEPRNWTLTELIKRSGGMSFYQLSMIYLPLGIFHYLLPEIKNALDAGIIHEDNTTRTLMYRDTAVVKVEPVNSDDILKGIVFGILCKSDGDFRSVGYLAKQSGGTRYRVEKVLIQLFQDGQVKMDGETHRWKAIV